MWEESSNQSLPTHRSVVTCHQFRSSSINHVCCITCCIAPLSRAALTTQWATGSVVSGKSSVRSLVELTLYPSCSFAVVIVIIPLNATEFVSTWSSFPTHGVKAQTTLTQHSTYFFAILHRTIHSHCNPWQQKLWYVAMEKHYVSRPTEQGLFLL